MVLVCYIWLWKQSFFRNADNIKGASHMRSKIVFYLLNFSVEVCVVLHRSMVKDQNFG